jgi:CMP/dCMP kinase
MTKGFSIAIDGPVAAGKGTIATDLTNRLGGFYIYTGAMYRSVALLCIERGIELENEEKVATVLPDVNMKFQDGRILLGDRDVTERIKEPDTARGSSIVARQKAVREDLIRKQQEIANKAMNNGQIVIVDGRDIGTNVLPNADLKIYLTANVDVRIERELGRYKMQGITKDRNEIIEEIKKRDERDFNRELDPLPADPLALGYWILDSSGQTESETVDIIIQELKKRGLINDQN